MSTYTLISSQVLGSSAASVTFSSIPQTYKDLVLQVSGRLTVANTQYFAGLTFNTDTSTNYSDTDLIANGTTPGSSQHSSSNYIYLPAIPAATATANTFGSFEIYVPSYTSASNKPLSLTGPAENNSASAFTLTANAGLWRNTAAINQIVLTTLSGNFVSGSSFYLYGI
jgi:hypothetical protein